MKKGNVPPHQGGCWFCFHDTEQGMVFDREFDTAVHLSCLNEALKDPLDEEAKIMAYLLEPADEGDFDA